MRTRTSLVGIRSIVRVGSHATPGTAITRRYEVSLPVPLGLAPRSQRRGSRLTRALASDWPWASRPLPSPGSSAPRLPRLTWSTRGQIVPTAWVACWSCSGS